jgi:hypothetical protein
MKSTTYAKECGIKQLKFNKFTQVIIFHLRKALKEIT